MRKTLILMAACAVLAAACGPGSLVLRGALDAERVNAGASEALDSPYLDLNAWLESVNACGRANGRPAPAPTFPGETYDDLSYVTRTSAIIDDDLAAQDIIDNLPGGVASVQVQAKWDRQGIATYRCPDDGLLYATGVLTDFVSTPSSGRYVSDIFTADEITLHDGLRYGTAPLCTPTGNDLLLDIYEPTIDTLAERPTIVVIHGGSFTGGDRKKFAGSAERYARRGFVAVAIEYRTCPGGFPDEDLIEVATNAIDDGMEAIRWLRANAATYGIDVDRIATVGSSAGAAISFGTALIDDPTPGGPLAAFDHQPNAAMGTGGHLTPAVETPGIVADPAPTMMFRYEFDGVAGPSDPSYEWPYSYQTCNGIHANGGICDFILLPGGGHVSGLSPTGGQSYWYMPWLYDHLDLANAN